MSEQLAFIPPDVGSVVVHGACAASGQPQAPEAAGTAVGKRYRPREGDSRYVDGLWQHSSGVLLPRGCIVLDRLTDDGLAELESASVARGVRRGDQVARRLRRSASDAEQLQAMCEWFHGHGLDGIGVVTFSDEYAGQRGIHSLARGLDDVWRGLSECPMNNGRSRGYRGRFVICGEWHRTGRDVPHVHIAFETYQAKGVCDDLWRYFSRTRGRSRFEPMRDVTTATLYGLKDTIKDSTGDGSNMRYRLDRKRPRKGHPSPSMPKATQSPCGARPDGC